MVIETWCMYKGILEQLLFFSGPITKALTLSPPPSLLGTFFFELQKSFFFLEVRPLKNTFFSFLFTPDNFHVIFLLLAAWSATIQNCFQNSLLYMVWSNDFLPAILPRE